MKAAEHLLKGEAETCTARVSDNGSLSSGCPVDLVCSSYGPKKAGGERHCGGACVVGDHACRRCVRNRRRGLRVGLALERHGARALFLMFTVFLLLVACVLVSVMLNLSIIAQKLREAVDRDRKG